MDSYLNDLSHGLRAQLRQPGLAAVAVLAFALGIGTAATHLPALDALFERPLPLPPLADQETLVCFDHPPERPPDRV